MGQVAEVEAMKASALLTVTVAWIALLATARVTECLRTPEPIKVTEDVNRIVLIPVCRTDLVVMTYEHGHRTESGYATFTDFLSVGHSRFVNTEVCQ